jgi:hypothetical protein
MLIYNTKHNLTGDVHLQQQTHNLTGDVNLQQQSITQTMILNFNFKHNILSKKR